MIDEKKLKELIDNLKGDSFTMPAGLSREQKWQFILDCAAGKVEPDKKEAKMIYQMMIKALQQLQASGTDIGNAIRYCSDNAFDLVHKYENGTSLDELLSICLNNK